VTQQEADTLFVSTPVANLLGSLHSLGPFSPHPPTPTRVRVPIEDASGSESEEEEEEEVEVVAPAPGDAVARQVEQLKGMVT